MRRFTGQAARHSGRLLHFVVQFALALLVAASVLAAGVAWRLGRGPVEVRWLVPILESQLNADGVAQVSVGGAAIAWEGFRGGLDQPIDIRLHNVVLTDGAGQRILAVPRAAVTLSPGWLLRGRIVPRAVALDTVGLHLRREADGTLRLDLPGAVPRSGPGPDVPALLRTLAARPRSDRTGGRFSAWSQLRRVRLIDAAAEVTDRRLGVTWMVPALQLDLHRPQRGGVTGRLTARIALGDLTATLTAAARLDPDGQRTELDVKTSPIVPAALARALPAARPLAAVAAPLSFEGTLLFGPGLTPRRMALTATLGAGTLHIAQGTMPVVSADAHVAGTPTHLAVTLDRFVTAPTPDGPRTTITGTGEVRRDADGGIGATAALAIDRVAFADLPALWPVGLGGADARPWITENITAGEVDNFHVQATLRVPADFSAVTLTRLSGGGDGTDVTVHWLRPVPPIVHGTARLIFLDPDSLEVTASGGSEVIGRSAIAIRGGRVLFTGLEEQDQLADIDADVSGPVSAALALLGMKRIGLLARSPLNVAGARGQFTGTIKLTQMPLRKDLSTDDLHIGTTLRLTGVHIAGIAAGRDLDQGMLDLTADPDGMHVAGTAQLAGIPAKLDARLDFRTGPPGQVLQTIAVNGTLDDARLAALGVPAAPFAAGRAPVSARLAMRRNGTGTAEIQADLTDTAISLDALSWAKPRGRPAQAWATIRLDHERVTGIDRISARGDGLQFAGAVRFAGGRPNLVELDRLTLGSATDAHGTVGVPARPDAPWRIDLAGPSIDAASLLRHSKAGQSPPQARGPAYSVTARFDRVILGPGRRLDDVTAAADSDGVVLRRLDLTGRTTVAQPFSLSIAPSGTGRTLAGSAADAGGLLRAFDVLTDMQGGRLSLQGRYDDTAPGRPLIGKADIESFQIRGAPALAKLLQAMTLYGLVDAVRGPGLGFRRLIAPFRLQDGILTLQDARAFSSSLGMTAKGRIDLRRREFDMEGTIVPAYFFNSLLGDLPLVGRMFSPERGGGVFAATYTLRGPMNDPRVGVNPLAALTPGFLRGLFGLFDRGSPSR